MNDFTNGILIFYEYTDMLTYIKYKQREKLIKGWRNIFWGDKKLRRNIILQVKKGNGSGAYHNGGIGWYEKQVRHKSLINKSLTSIIYKLCI